MIINNCYKMISKPLILTTYGVYAITFISILENIRNEAVVSNVAVKAYLIASLALTFLSLSLDRYANEQKENKIYNRN